MLLVSSVPITAISMYGVCESEVLKGYCVIYEYLCVCVCIYLTYSITIK